MLKEILKEHENIEVVAHSGLVVDFAKTHKVGVMVRGVRLWPTSGTSLNLQ